MFLQPTGLPSLMSHITLPYDFTSLIAYHPKKTKIERFCLCFCPCVCICVHACRGFFQSSLALSHGIKVEDVCPRDHFFLYHFSSKSKMLQWNFRQWGRLFVCFFYLEFINVITSFWLGGGKRNFSVFLESHYIESCLSVVMVSSFSWPGQQAGRGAGLLPV